MIGCGCVDYTLLLTKWLVRNMRLWLLTLHLSLERSCMPSHLSIVLPITFAILSATGCSNGNAQHVAAAPPPQAVSVVELQPRTVPIFAEYAAQTFARDAADIRGQVDGYVRK